MELVYGLFWSIKILVMKSKFCWITIFMTQPLPGIPSFLQSGGMGEKAEPSLWSKEEEPSPSITHPSSCLCKLKCQIATNNFVSAHQLQTWCNFWESQDISVGLLDFSLNLQCNFVISSAWREKNAVVKKLILYATKFDNLSAKCNALQAPLLF